MASNHKYLTTLKKQKNKHNKDPDINKDKKYIKNRIPWPKSTIKWKQISIARIIN